MERYFDLLHCSGKRSPGHVPGYRDQFTRAERPSGSFHGRQVIRLKVFVAGALRSPTSRRHLLDDLEPPEGLALTPSMDMLRSHGR